MIPISECFECKQIYFCSPFAFNPRISYVIQMTQSRAQRKQVRICCVLQKWLNLHVKAPDVHVTAMRIVALHCAIEQLVQCFSSGVHRWGAKG